MSQTFRTRLLRLQREQLQLEQQQWQFIQEHIADFCIESDKLVHEVFGAQANEDECLKNEKMNNEEFIKFSMQVVDKVFKKFGMNKKKAQIIDYNLDEEYQEIAIEQGQKMIHEEPIAEEVCERESEALRDYA